jgi:hypothetical protein
VSFVLARKIQILLASSTTIRYILMSQNPCRAKENHVPKQNVELSHLSGHAGYHCMNSVSCGTLDVL